MDEKQPSIESITGMNPPGPGASCPNCGKGKLDYNGLLELECPRCGYVISSGAGCT